jgi:hypothetical protein
MYKQPIGEYMTSFKMKAPDGNIYSVSPNNVTSVGLHKFHSESVGLARDFTSLEMASANTVVF